VKNKVFNTKAHKNVAYLTASVIFPLFPRSCTYQYPNFNFYTYFLELGLETNIC